MLLNKVLLPALLVLCSAGLLKAQVATNDNANYLQGLRKISSERELKYADSLTEAKGISKSDIRFLSQDYKKLHYMEFANLIESSQYKLTADVYVDASSLIRAKVARPATKEEQVKALEDFRKFIEAEAKSPKGLERASIIASQVGKPAPLFSVTDVDGVKWDLNQLKGKVVVLNFWFIGCAPCKKEMPELNALVEKYKGKEVVFLAFEVNNNTADKIKAVGRDFHYTHVPTTRKEGVVIDYQIKSYPTSYVIDQSGIVRFGLAAYNPFRLPEMDETIEALLMKKPLATKKPVATSIAVNAQESSINFEHGTWAEIKAKAAKEKKVIFMDCYTSWCGPCKKLAKEVFTLKEVADYYNANFINAKMDMEKGEGPQLAKQYGIHAYPSLLFVTPEGKLISKNEGAPDFKAFIEYGKKAVSGESLESLMAEYKKGNRSPEFMKKYMTRMEGIKENTAVIIEEYFTRIPQAQWQTAENWYFINRYVRTEQSPVFKYVVQNQKAYEQKFTAEAVSDYFVKVYEKSIQNAANGAFPVEDLKDLKGSFGKMNFAGAGKLVLQCDAAAASISKDMKAYADVMEVIFSKYPEKKIEDRIVAVGSFCWKMLNQASDPYVLQKATKLAEMSIQVQNAEFMDVYARLLVETGNFDKGIEVEEKVIAMLKAKPDPDVSLTACEDRLEKFKRRKAAASSTTQKEN